MTTLQPGSQFAGRYRIEGCIAQGAMGAVYEVTHLETRRRRALKIMHPHVCETAGLRDRFRAEAQVAAQIDSEFVVDVFDAGVDESTQMPFLVMELLRGEELGKRLQRLGRFSPEETVTYLWQTALALDKTHQANIVHRDLKPANLFLTTREDGPPRIKVLDFGVAKFVAETATASGSTRSLGTPVYMSPEQFRSQAVTAASDNYALAMLAYTLIVGESYWALEAGASSDIIAFALTATMGPPDRASVRARPRGVQLPPTFDAWFARATAVSPQQRFARATESIIALAQVYSVTLDARQMPTAPDLAAPRLTVPMAATRLTPGASGAPFASSAAIPLITPEPSFFGTQAPMGTRTPALESHSAAPIAPPEPTARIASRRVPGPTMMSEAGMPTVGPTNAEASVSHPPPKKGAAVPVAIAVVGIAVAAGAIGLWAHFRGVTKPVPAAQTQAAPSASVAPTEAPSSAVPTATPSTSALSAASASASPAPSTSASTPGGVGSAHNPTRNPRPVQAHTQPPSTPIVAPTIPTYTRD